MDVMSPPRYQRFSSRLEPALNVDDLPVYTRRTSLARPLARREPTEHVFVLTEKARPWVTLKLYSSAKSPKSLPTFFEQERINGVLQIYAEPGASIQSVTATVTGRIITGANSKDSYTFLCQSLPIWAKSSDIPRVPSASQGASNNKLHGQCEWPLSIPLPSKVQIPDAQGTLQTFHLPETFLERHTCASVQYDLTILISRGKLRQDSRIRTAFGYVPSSRPDPPSLQRRLAYQQCALLPGPEHDPQGWKTLTPIRASGVMKNRKCVNVICTLSLARPLCYTRGSVIPCSMKLESDDEYILDTFANPSAIAVHLQRRVRFAKSSMHGKQGPVWNETVADMGTAVWWSSPNHHQDVCVRYLDGEIHLAKDLRPSSSIGHFSISYSVVIRPFKVPRYSSDVSILLSEPVDIATMHAKGPRPYAYAPPAYGPVTSPPDIYSAPFSPNVPGFS